MSSLGAVVVRAPNHLGDGVMALPAIRALAARAQALHVLGPAWAPTLYRGLGASFGPALERPKGDTGVLLAPSFSSAWRLRHLPSLVGVSGQGRGLLLSASVPASSQHRSMEYAQILALIGVQVLDPPSFTPTDSERRRACQPQGHLAIAPFSPSGEAVMWPGFQQLAQASADPVVVYLGPGDRWPSPWPVFQEADLGLLAAELERARVLVVNDSGFSHFARALGVPTVVVHGSTDPARTGAAGSHSVQATTLPSCWPCYAKSCSRPGVPCLEIPVSAVQRAAGAQP